MKRNHKQNHWALLAGTLLLLLTFAVAPSLSEGTACEKHDFVNGICSVCGEKNTCAHPRLMDTEYRADMTYTPIDANSHSFSGKVYAVKMCLECWDVLFSEEDLLTDADASGVESHSFEDSDQCEDCGYVTQCKHETKSKDWYHHWINETYAPNDTETHTVTGVKVKGDKCLDCGRIFWKDDEGVECTEKESHHYLDGRDVCLNCGYVNDCKHEQMTSAGYYWNNAVYTPNDAATHMVTGVKVTGERCLDCGRAFWKEDEGVECTQTQSHYYDENNVCVYCGYQNACSHQNVTKYEDFVGDKTFTPLNEKEHTTTGIKGFSYYCQDCGAFWQQAKENAKPKSEKEAHRFGNGRCIECGYINTCAHENVEYHPISGDVDGEWNIVYGSPYSTLWCQCVDCRETWTIPIDQEPPEQLTVYAGGAASSQIDDYRGAMTQTESGWRTDFKKYGWIPEETISSLLGSFSIFDPMIEEAEKEINLDDLISSGGWAVLDFYRFVLGGDLGGAQPIRLEELRAFFGNDWKDTTGFFFAGGTCTVGDTVYAWMPMYYETKKGQILDDALYLYVYIVSKGADTAYLEGKLYTAVPGEYRAEKLLIADQRFIRDFLNERLKENDFFAQKERQYLPLFQGAESETVRAIQKKLIRLGFQTSSADGIFGDLTAKALAAYQKSVKLKGETGVADVETQRRLLSTEAECALLKAWLDGQP